MTEIIVTNCADCPFSEWGWNSICTHPKSKVQEDLSYSEIANDCPLIKEETVIKVKND